MSKKHRSSIGHIKLPNPQLPVKPQEYDLTQSFKNVSKYTRPSKNRKTYETGGENSYYKPNLREYISNDNISEDKGPTGSSYLDRYDRLDDRITSFFNKNEDEHKSLRQELESKIEKNNDKIEKSLKDLQKGIESNVSMKLYGYTISALFLFITLIWILSYQDVYKVPSELIKIEHRIDNLEKDFNLILDNDTIKDLKKK